MAPGSVPGDTLNGPARSTESRAAQAVPRPRGLRGAVGCVWQVDTGMAQPVCVRGPVSVPQSVCLPGSVAVPVREPLSLFL